MAHSPCAGVRDADMPYFLYKVFTGRKFELVERFDSYRDARDKARERRKHLTPEDSFSIKVMFAKDPDEAERLMSEEREPRPLGEDA